MLFLQRFKIRCPAGRYRYLILVYLPVLLRVEKPVVHALIHRFASGWREVLVGSVFQRVLKVWGSWNNLKKKIIYSSYKLKGFQLKSMSDPKLFIIHTTKRSGSGFQHKRKIVGT